MIELLGSLVWAMSVGTVVALLGVWLGWFAGRWTSMAPVRLIAWWVDHVAQPLVTHRAWWRRAVGVFANNVVVCAAVVMLGYWPATSWAAVAGLGVSLGLGLRALSTADWAFGEPAAGDRRVGIGVALNMLEPPAIIFALGLSLGQSAMPVGISLFDAMIAYAELAVPLLAVAACGEALWLGATLKNRLQPTEIEVDPRNSCQS